MSFNVFDVVNEELYYFTCSNKCDDEPFDFLKQSAEQIRRSFWQVTFKDQSVTFSHNETWFSISLKLGGWLLSETSLWKIKSAKEPFLLPIVLK